MRRARVTWLGLAMAMLAAPLAARATVLQRMEIEDLARSAHVVAIVRVESVRAAWERDQGSIRTHAVLVRESDIAGSAPERIHVSVLGGTVDGVSAAYSAGATFREGERLAIFLEPRRGHAGEWLVTGAFQGAFELERERETGMDVAVRASSRAGVALAPEAETSDDLRLYVDELVARVRAVRGAR
jgi:hypothetical protein